MNPAPHEIILGPMTLWRGPVGTAFPKTDEAPSVSWTLVGTSGNRNYTEDGVRVSLSETLGFFRGLGSTLPLKAIRSEEDVMVNVTIADLSLEQVALALNGNQVASVAAGADAGYKSLALYRGPDVTTMALLARGASPYAETGYGQFELPQVVVESAPAIVYTKSGDPAALELTFRLMADLEAAEAAQAGYFRAMTAPATT